MNVDLLDAARCAALKAGNVLLKNYGKLKHFQIRQKTRNDFVTAIDKQSERVIIGMLKSRFPSHAIQAEESGIQAGEEIRWVIDPLDGTTNYIHQFPLFAVSIAAVRCEEPVAGVVYDPVHRELFTARKGHGAFLNGRRIGVSKVRRLGKSLMATGIPFRARGRFESYLASLRDISMGSTGLRRGGSAALDLAYVACGRFDGFWEINLSAWDIAAGALLVREAGGQVSDLWGGETFWQNGDILASNGRIHRELVSVTRKHFVRGGGRRNRNTKRRGKKTR